MSTATYQAIIARWDAQSLDSVFGGGIWASEAPPETPWPYVVFSRVSSAPDGWSTNSEVRDEQFQFDIWYLEEINTDPLYAVGRLLDSLKSAYEYAPLLIGGEPSLICRRLGEDIQLDGDGVWHARIDYRIRHTRTVNYGPA